MFVFKRWKEQNEETRDIVRQLVEEGRLEFINGGKLITYQIYNSKFIYSFNHTQVGVRYLYYILERLLRHIVDFLLHYNFTN